MSQLEIIVDVNAGDFLKSILNVGDFTRKFKCHYYIINAGDSRPILENWNVYGLRYNGKIFFTLIFYTVKKLP